MDNIYLDTHTAPRPFSTCLEKMLPLYKEHTARELYDKSYLVAYEKCEMAIREALGDEEQRSVYFCSGGAEAVNSALFSYYFQRARETGKTHIMAPRTESAPILLSLQRLEEWGCSGKLLPLNAQGQLTKETLLNSINPRTGLLSLSWAQPLTGVIHPLAELAEVCRDKQVALHVDGSFVLGKFYFNLSDLPIDYFTYDGALVHGPQAAGALLMPKGEKHAPLILGAERAPLPALTALSYATLENARGCDQICLEGARLRDKLQRGIKNAVPDAHIFFEEVERLPSCTAIAFPGIHAEALLCLLQRRGVYASIGGGTQQRLTDVLLASGASLSLAQSALSFSLSLQTTEEEIDAAIQRITSCVHQLKRSSLQGVPL